jgi:hypothetical protein
MTVIISLWAAPLCTRRRLVQPLKRRSTALVTPDYEQCPKYTNSVQNISYTRTLSTPSAEFFSGHFTLLGPHARNNDAALKGSANIEPISPIHRHCINFTSLLKSPTVLPLESMGQEAGETKETVHMLAKRIIVSKPVLIPSLSQPPIMYCYH